MQSAHHNKPGETWGTSGYGAPIDSTNVANGQKCTSAWLGAMLLLPPRDAHGRRHRNRNHNRHPKPIRKQFKDYLDVITLNSVDATSMLLATLNVVNSLSVSTCRLLISCDRPEAGRHAGTVRRYSSTKKTPQRMKREGL
jgi:hypothetical protein